MSPTWVWTSEREKRRNAFSLFRRRFTLDRVPSSATIHLFVDQRYRLWVNGKPVERGPIRFLPVRPHFDSVDLTPWLRTGENEILVEAYHGNALSFQTVASRAGFIAWGEAGIHSLSTPGEWEGKASSARDPEAEPWSFAQGPIELLDFEVLRSEMGSRTGWSALAAVPDPHWGSLAARPIPPFGQDLRRPREIKRAKLARPIRAIWRTPSSVPIGHRQWMRAVIHSPVEQTALLGLFWGPVWLNGERVIPIKQDTLHRGNRQNAAVRLRAGANELIAAPEVLEQCWAFAIEFPAFTGVTIEPYLGGAIPPTPEPEIRLRTDEAWRPDRGDSPARDMAWDVPRYPITEPLLEAPSTLVLDIGGEVLGHWTIRLKSEGVCTVDVAMDERLRPDGCLGLFETHHGINCAERVRLPAGEHVVEGFHERGFRYLQVTVRESEAPVEILGVEVLDKRQPLEVVGRFSSDDPLLDWCHRVGITTQLDSLTDGWIDPWRERGMYIGDTYVEAQATAMGVEDRRTERWALRLWADSQSPEGQLSDVVPSYHSKWLTEYTLIWVLILHQRWAWTGDVDTVRELLPHVDRILDSDFWESDEDGLWTAGPHAFVFGDWGVVEEERLGSNGILNAFRVLALEAAADLEGALGHAERADARRAEAEGVRKAYQTHLWREEDGRFGCNRTSDAPSVHANVLAVLAGIPRPEQSPRLWKYLEAKLAENVLLPPGNLQPYFFVYLLPILARTGRFAFAEETIREHYGAQFNRGAWALWERFSLSEADLGSHCHGWSAAPTIYLSTETLGVKPAVPGHPDHWRIEPASETLDRASGVVPTVRGPISVDWRVEGSALVMEVVHPEGTTVEVAPRGRLASLERRFTIRT